MKKHFLYASTAALLAMSFASCVDNDEPRGLRELRYAKANEWNANADWKRATIYGDSLLHLFTAQAQELANKGVELDNLKKQADNNYKIEKQNYQLALDKARIDLKLAQAKDSLARENESNEKALEQFKADLIAKQIIAKQAEEKLAAFEAQAKNRQDSLNAEVKKKQAEFADKLADAQDALNRNKLHADSLAAKLEASIYETNLNCLLIVAAAHKDAWDNSKNKVYNAYSNLNAKQKAMRDKELALFKAQQNLLYALNKYEEDSAANHKALADSINNAQYALDWASKRVILAENVLADFEDNSQANKETWTKKYNEYKAAIDALANEIDEYKVQIADAEAVYSADTMKYNNKKKEIEKPLKEYNDKIGYHTFILDDEIAGDTLFKLPAGAKDFELKQGVIANKEGIKNSDLNAQLDAILNAIGDDDHTTNFFYNAKALKSANDNIEKFNKKIEGYEKKLNDTIDMYTAKKNEKIADKNLKSQKLAEYKALTNTKNKYEEQKATFEAAVTAYKAAALAYEFSEENGKKSDIYERFAKLLAKEIKAFNVAYQAEVEKGVDGELYGSAMNKKRQDIVKLAKNGDDAKAAKSDKYWDLRKAFDGTKSFKDAKDAIAQGFWNFGTQASDYDDWDNETNVKNVFDQFVLVADPANIKDEDIYNDKNGLVDVILKANTRSEGNDKGDGVNAYQTYVDAATDFIGADDRYNVYTEEEIKSLKAEYEADNTKDKYTKLATTYDYWNWKFTIEKLEEDVAKAQSDTSKTAGKYTNPGVDQCEEIIANAETYAATKTAEDQAKIDSIDLRLTNSAYYKDLYDEIKAVKDANDAEIKKLTIAQQEAYKTELTSFETLSVADKKKIDDLKLKQGIAKSDSTYKDKAMKAYNSLVLKCTDTTGSAADARLGNADIAAEIIVEYTIINLQYAVDEAKEAKEKAKMDLDNAKKHLTDFEAGERDWKRNNYASVINANQQLITEAELLYEHATKEYEVALKYYNDVLAAIEEEE